MFAGLISDLSTDCENYLGQISAMNFTAAFDASGETEGEASGSELIGFVTQWFDPQNNRITNLEQSTFRVCAFVDTNNDGELTFGEPVGSGDVTMGVTTAVIDDWFNSN